MAARVNPEAILAKARAQMASCVGAATLVPHSASTRYEYMSEDAARQRPKSWGARFADREHRAI